VVTGTLDHIAKFQLLQLVEEFAVAAVLLVGRDPIQGHDVQQGRLSDQPRGDLGLGLEDDPLGDVGLVAALVRGLAVLAPRLGQVEPMIQQRRAAGGDAHQEHPDLAVVFLAEPAVVLPAHARAVIALLGEARSRQRSPRHRWGCRRRWGQLVDEQALELGLASS